uniref:Uncharacterized protein n=1 Tax=Helianthus annuus TaxID=4232 RepID=A0A251ST06_HELAN
MRQSGWDHSTLQYTERKQSPKDYPKVFDAIHCARCRVATLKVLGLETEIRMLKSLDLQSLARLRWVSHSD